MGLTPIPDLIRSRGHWSVSICPAKYQADRVQYSDLLSNLESVVVRLRGWPVPFIDRRQALLRGDDWTGQDFRSDAVGHVEAWRFLTSGQFSHLRGVSAHWRDGAERAAVPAGFDCVIEVWEVLFYLTEVYELAARLALSPAGDDEMRIVVELAGLAGCALVVGQTNRAEFFAPRTAMATFSREKTVLRDDLVASPRDLAVGLAREYFERCGWDASPEQLSGHQEELTRGR